VFLKPALDLLVENRAEPAVAKRLVVGTVPHDFSPDTHLALGPWCFFKAEDRYPEWDTLAFVDPFATRAARDAGGRASNALTKILIGELHVREASRC